MFKQVKCINPKIFTSIVLNPPKIEIFILNNKKIITMVNNIFIVYNNYSSYIILFNTVFIFDFNLPTTRLELATFRVWDGHSNQLS